MLPRALDSPERLAFENLEGAFTTASIYVHLDPDKERWLETDAADYAVAAILSQWSKDGQLHPVASMSKKIFPQAYQCEMHSKELSANHPGI